MWWAAGVELVAVGVDRNVVVVPAQGGEVVRIMAAAVGPRGDVVRLQAVPAHASIDGAVFVSEQDTVTGCWRDGSGRV